MDFRQSRLATVVLLVPVVGMALLAVADVGVGRAEAFLAPGAAYAPIFWGAVLLVESGMLLVTVLALPAPRLLLTRDSLAYLRPLRPEVMIRWDDIHHWEVAAGRDKGGTRVRLVVLAGARGAHDWSPLAALTRRTRAVEAITLDTRGWRLVRPAAPDGGRIFLGEVLLDCLRRPEVRARLAEDAEEPSASGPARVVGKRAALAAVALAIALQLSTMMATNGTLFTPQSLLNSYGRAVALLLVLAGLASWIAGTNGTVKADAAEAPDAAARRARWRVLAVACFLLGALVRLASALLWNRAGLLAMYFDLRGTWLLLAVTLPLAPALLPRRGREWLAGMLAGRRRDVERMLWFGLALFLVVGPYYQDYLNQLYGNQTWGLMSFRDSVFLPYAPLCVAALCAFSASAPAAIQRVLLFAQGLAGLAMVAIAELFILIYGQVMAEVNAWMTVPPNVFDDYTTRQLVLAFFGGLVIEGLALSELVSLSPRRVIGMLVGDARGLAVWGRAALASLTARRFGFLDMQTVAALLFSRWRIYSVFAALIVFVTVAAHLAQPLPVAACCRVGIQAVRPPSVAKSGDVWVRPIDGMRMRYVPATRFMMGLPESAVTGAQALCRQQYGPESAACDPSVYAVSEPQHAVSLGGYWIDETDVTNAQFVRFVAATGYVTDAEREGWGWVWMRPGGDTRLPGANWRHPLGPESSIAGLGGYPVVQVSWHDAEAYATWAGMALPTEEQWELAAHGPAFQPYPWGSAPMDGTRANFCDAACPRYVPGQGHDGYAYTSPAGHYPAGASPYGVLDMTGDVLQWTSSVYAPYSRATYQDPVYGKGYYVERGSTYAEFPAAAYTSTRLAASPDYRSEYVGVRCASPVAASG